MVIILSWPTNSLYHPTPCSRSFPILYVLLSYSFSPLAAFRLWYFCFRARSKCRQTGKIVVCQIKLLRNLQGCCLFTSRWFLWFKPFFKIFSHRQMLAICIMYTYMLKPSHVHSPNVWKFFCEWFCFMLHFWISETEILLKLILVF